MKAYIIYMEGRECLHNQRGSLETRNQIERGQEKKDNGLTFEQLFQESVKVLNTKPHEHYSC